MHRYLFALLLSLALPVSAATQVLVTTNLGELTVQLDEKNAPLSSQNFLRYVEDGSYVGTIFHRVIPGFMAQGGGFDKDLQRRPTYEPIKKMSLPTALAMREQPSRWHVPKILTQQLVSSISIIRTIRSWMLKAAVRAMLYSEKL